MNLDVLGVLSIVLAYFLGSLSSAIIVCHLMKLEDPRKVGSKNPGATNVLRIGGGRAAIITLMGDVFKGLVSVIIAYALLLPVQYIALVGFMVFVGHLYPVFFAFKGGKGVATFVGVLIGFNWLCGLMVVVTWLLVTFIFRISSLAALTSAFMSPIYFLVVVNDIYVVTVISLMAMMIFWRHKINIHNLIEGTESKIGLGKK
ncbi:MAG: glycerol-3-phosphate 1-O-acyltransferase PlsY [Methylococcales bacterium]|nr:glycerol-3-phosphate 1-O-acyltransferase PlsY [Methylococcales bacterium]MBT7410966.1 glycerol-3-phosphate 1-O-acyltransferase PlsY [Methylococcales bacterium]